MVEKLDLESHSCASMQSSWRAVTAIRALFTEKYVRRRADYVNHNDTSKHQPL